MITTRNSVDDRRSSRFSGQVRIIPIVAGLAAIFIAFAVASSGAGRFTAFALTAFAAAVFVIISAAGRTASAVKHQETEADAAIENVDGPTGSSIEERLIALDEANEVFGSSLNASDMFRLVSSRVGELFPFAAAVLAVPGETEGSLRFVHSDGVNAEALRDVEVGTTESLAGRSFGTGKIVAETGELSDAKIIGEERVAGFVSAVAIPLVYGDRAFGVFQLFLAEPLRRDDDSLRLMEAIGEHVTPIFRSSLAFERTLSSALTDVLTGLPNERAFYMVLENQLAESLRNRDERPLTILSIDIRDFGAVNSMLGHAVGDQMLEFAGSRIGEQLRKMDFLARTVNDEFSVILPTANEKTAFEIVDRIRAAFEQNEFDLSDGESVVIALNIGWATFWKDGETVEQLIRAAHQRKRQAKSEEPADVLWFPKEYVN